MTRFVKLGRRAMGTFFEVLVCGEEEAFLRSVAEEALNEIDRLDEQMSLYLPSSEICWINGRAFQAAVRVEPRLYRLLERAFEMTRETHGAFDVAVAPMVKAWGFFDGERGDVRSARRISGMRHVRLEAGAISFRRRGVALDLGAIGKGYALDRAADLLRSRGIDRALLHGGKSSILAMGAWPIGLVDPRDSTRRFGRIELRDQALSASSGLGRFFTRGKRTYGHILDPRTGSPVQGMLGAWCAASSSADSDALSTAFYVLGIEGARRYGERHPTIAWALMSARGFVSGNIPIEEPPKEEGVSRRAFMKGTAAATAAFVMGRSVTAQDKPSEHRSSVSVAIIGVGEQGRLLLSQLVRMPRVQIAAVCDPYKPHLDKALDLTGRRTEGYPDFKQLLEEEDVQAIVIATPPHLHAVIGRAALEAGKHVFCESPLANTLEEAREIVRIARKAGRIFQVGHHRRASKLYRHALTHVKSGSIGKILKIRAQWHRKQSWRRAITDKTMEKSLNWRLYKATSGGLLLEQGTHLFDLVHWYWNALPLSVMGLGGLTLWKDGREVDDNVDVLVEYPEGVQVHLSLSLTNSYMDEYELLMGTQGAILLTGQRRGLYFKEADAVQFGWENLAKKEMLGGFQGILLDAEATQYKTHEDAEPLIPDVGKADTFSELEEFATAVRGGGAPSCDVEAGFRAAATALAAQEALEKKSVVRFGKEHFE